MIEKKFRVAEIFGPTIQGEGSAIGQPCYFIRFGGCDFKCSWCDSMHAVDPEQVKKLPLMTTYEIMGKLEALPGNFKTVILSGGNPLIWDLSDLMNVLWAHDYKVHVETQGSTWKSWASQADLITISPKPPSAGVFQNLVQLQNFIRKASPHTEIYLKIVVFDLEDLIHAFDTARFLDLPLNLSIGTKSTDLSQDLLARYRWITDLVLSADTSTVLDTTGVVVNSILPQMHVLMHGHKLGV